MLLNDAVDRKEGEERTAEVGSKTARIQGKRMRSKKRYIIEGKFGKRRH